MSHFFFFFNDTATTEIYTLPYTTLFRSNGFVYWESRSSPWSPPRRDRRRRRLNGRIRRPAGPRRGLSSRRGCSVGSRTSTGGGHPVPGGAAVAAHPRSRPPPPRAPPGPPTPPPHSG